METTSLWFPIFLRKRISNIVKMTPRKVSIYFFYSNYNKKPVGNPTDF